MNFSCEFCNKSFFSYERKKFCSKECYYLARDKAIDNIALFWQKVGKKEENDCWIWKAALSTHGYGKLGIKGKTILAHRFSYELHYGTIPEGKQINHHCDVRTCVNPKHLYAGTAKENTRDMVERKRGHLFQAGEQHHAAKLKEHEVEIIRTSAAKSSELSEKFGVNVDHITRIKRGERWDF